MTREEINQEKQKKISYEINREKVKNIIKIALKAIIIIAVLSTLFFTYTTYISTAKINVREYRITNTKIPESFNGMKIIHFSDLHYGSTMFDENMKDIKKIIKNRKPDMIVFTGDLIDKNYKITEKQKEKLANTLKSLDTTLGKYAILGDEDKEEVITIFNQSDFTILKNESELIYNEKNEPILLIGLESSLSGNQNIENGFNYFKQETHNNDIYTITLVHEPDTVVDMMGTYKSDLILAGHSHNGNIRVPIINLPLERKQGAKKYINEYYKIENTDLYISSGLGTNNKTGIRLFCRPSINFYRISKE